MANTSYKGTVVKIGSIMVDAKGSAGTTVKFRVLFSDSDGAVHGTMNHEVSVEDPAFQGPVKALHDACRAFAERVHFNAPNSTPITTVAITRGISESLSEQPDVPEEPGEQG